MNPTMDGQDYPIIDGFLYNTRLRPNLTNLAMVLREYESLRKSGAFKTRWLCIPENAHTQLIPAANEYSFQCFVTPGAAYWGWIFIGDSPQLYSIQVIDHATKVPLWSVEMSTARSTGSVNPGFGRQNTMQKLLIIPRPGVIDVSICSLNSSDAFDVQLILCGGEPVPEEECAQFGVV